MKEKEYMRLESDSIGTMEVPEDAYYGVQALRPKKIFRLPEQNYILFSLKILQKSSGQLPLPTEKPED